MTRCKSFVFLAWVVTFVVPTFCWNNVLSFVEGSLKQLSDVQLLPSDMSGLVSLCTLGVETI